MFLMKTYIDKSSISGFGVFAGEDIAKGTLVWQFIEGFDLCTTEEKMKNLPLIAQHYIKQRGALQAGEVIMGMDFDQFTNHSDNPSLALNTLHSAIATRDIRKGEELTYDYRSFDEYAEYKLSTGCE